MQLVISEKPSVAMALAKALGVTEKKKGWIEGNGYIISWCVGHLVGLANADAYNERYKKWNLDDLPIIPETWKFVVSKDKNKQFSILKELMNDSRVTETVNACDAGREGELIFRLVYDKAGCRKPLTKEIVEALLKNGKTEVRGLYSQKSKRNYDAIVCLDDTGKYVNFKLEFAPRKVKK